MTPRLARLGGWILLAGVVGTVVACTTPNVEGSDLDSNDETSASTAKKSSSKKSTGSASTATTTSKPRTPSTTTGTTPSVPPTTTTTATTPPTTTTPPPPPPVTQPNCTSGGDAQACLDCCEASNPGATFYENAYTDCLSAGVDPAQCKSEHLNACAGNAACTANHACMEANNCLATNLCQ